MFNKMMTSKIKQRGGKGFFKRKNLLHSNNAVLYLMMIPFFVWTILFQWKPMWGLQIAFKDYSLYGGMAQSPWVGFDNFEAFLSSPYIFRLLKNTFLTGLYSIIFSFPVPIILAILLNEVRCKKYKQIVQTITYVPYLISTVVVCSIVTNLLSGDGIINVILTKMGMEKIRFLSNPDWFRTIYIGSGIWQNSGYSAVLYLAALSGIDQQLYEACSIDGGNKFRQLWHVTLPGILPTISIMLILACGSILNVGYEKIILLYQPSTYETADVLSTYMYRTGLSNGDYGMATAVGFFNSVISLVLVAIANVASKRLSGSSLW